MRIATWNVNSIRARLDRLVAWIERSDIDVLAIQETKVADAKFPSEALTNLGYEVVHHGLNQWNGVAIISRVGIDDVQSGFDSAPGWGDPLVKEARAIGATCGGVRVWSLYIPNGRSLGDPHLDYKLSWLEGLRQDAIGWMRTDPHAQIALCGDFNIAPTDEDVWDMDYFVNSTHVTPEERKAFFNLVDAGFSDVVRPYTEGPGVYTYWDYQQLRFAKRQGMRIDFALCTPALAARVNNAFIDREERKGKGSSDHTPVVVELS